MRSLKAALFVFVTCVLVARGASAQLALPAGGLQKWPALDLDAGAAYGAGDLRWTYLGRIGAGLHLLNRHRVATLTGLFEMLGSEHKAFGARAELASIESGLGVAGSATLSTHGNPGIHVGASLSLLHVEGMFVFGDHSTRAVVAFLRIPLGLVGFGIWGNRQ